jgi:hypothetical protein
MSHCLVPSLLLLFCLAVSGSAEGQVESIRVTGAVATPGATVRVSTLVDSSGELSGWSFGVCYDSAAVDLAGLEDGAAVTAVSPDFHVVEAHPGGVTVGTVISFFPPYTPLPPGVGHELLHIDLTVLAPAGAVVPIEPCAVLGSPPVALVLVVAGVETIPATVGSVIEINDQAIFMRGDANGDGAVSLVDVIGILEILFTPVGIPACEDRLDANDDELLNVLDAIALLELLFGGGATIPQPYPSCGVDPTTLGSLACSLPSTSCP